MNELSFDAMLKWFVEQVADRVATQVAERAAKKADAEPELITMREFARRHSISETTVRTMIRDGRLDAVKIGAAVRIRSDAQIGKPAPRSPTVMDSPKERAAKILLGRQS